MRSVRTMSRLAASAAILCSVVLCGIRTASAQPVPGAALEPIVQKDVEYGRIEQTQLLLDVYRPPAAAYAGKRPGLVLIHGGGFIGGDKGFYAPMGVEYARHGYVVFSLNYRLAPAFHYPAQVDDVQRAVRWIRSKAEQYELDPNRIGALGDSAGGYLVAMLGLRTTRDNSDAALASFSSKVACVVDLYGPTDFTLPASMAGINPQAIQLLILFFGKKQDEAVDLYRDGSPVTWVDKQAASFLIIHGTADPLVPDDQSRRLCDALKGVGDEVTLIEMYKFGHGFLSPANPGQTGVLAEAFLRDHLKP